uniref:Uncharacterized protein n=1 Tax=Lepeophtheirus salmonis TaxID=72036 RepID=A0A0K2T1B4_LEPSM
MFKKLLRLGRWKGMEPSWKHQRIGFVLEIHQRIRQIALGSYHRKEIHHWHLLEQQKRSELRQLQQFRRMGWGLLWGGERQRVGIHSHQRSSQRRRFDHLHQHIRKIQSW